VLDSIAGDWTAQIAGRTRSGRDVAGRRLRRKVDGSATPVPFVRFRPWPAAGGKKAGWIFYAAVNYRKSITYADCAIKVQERPQTQRIGYPPRNPPLRRL